MQTINPATEEVVAAYAEHSDEQVEARVEKSHAAFLDWRNTSFADRAQVLRAASDQLRSQSAELAKLIVLEMGKPITEAEAEIEKCAWVCEFYSEMAARYLEAEQVPTEAKASYVRFDPLGPVLAVMPWNFPFWQVFRFLAPALMAGNTGLLKHASNVTGCALAIERVMAEAGLPSGAFATLVVNSSRIADVIAHQHVRAVTLTGSDAAGRAVAEQAGRSLKKCVLELGGSDPFMVLADADVPAAARQAARARMINGGQSCIAAKRFLVEAPVAEAFEEAFVEELQALAVGDPLHRETQLGPLARADLLSDLQRQVDESVSRGATLCLGGRRLERRGYFYPPTALTDVQPGMPAFDEEVFGPVAAMMRVSSADEAVELANRSCLGLGASIWTADVQRAQQLASRIESGCVFINEIVKSDPRMPFGGVKDSGFGRELSHYGIREFVNIKTVWVG